MIFKSGDICYILESNSFVSKCKVVNRSSNLYTVQLVGSCGAIRLPSHRLFATEEEALDSMKNQSNTMRESVKQNYEVKIPDVFEGRRTNRSPHTWHH